MPHTEYCDLHTHTLHSDGALEPEQLVDLAAGRGLVALALTDHDSIDGLPAAMRRGTQRGIEVIPGIELSVWEDGHEVHLLGYFVSRPDPLRGALAAIRAERSARARRIIDRLASLGFAVDSDAVEARARGGVVGRPHVAEELIAGGHATSVDEAFDRWLAVGRPAFEPKRTLGLVAAVELLRRAGAVPVVAHPGASDLDAWLPHLRAAGVLGLEVWHPKHDERQVRRYLRLARRHGLLPTGGSDFHREAPGGILPGEPRVPLAVLDALRPLAA